ncbi:MAG: response regulator [Nitrospinae bacterium]|nr:response regulator [Nitrospinota bacterium]
MGDPETAELNRSALVIDEYGVSRLIIEEELESVGLRVFQARNPKEGMELALEKSPDIIVIDPTVAGYDGFKMVSELKVSERTRDIPVVAVLGVGVKAAEEAGFKSGVITVFQKPFQVGKLGGFVEAHLQAGAGRKSSCILLVEDSNTIRAVTKYLLEKNGHQVLEAEDGAKGWDILKEKSDGLDMVITDINMPNMDGRELVGLIRGDRRYQFIPIVVSTTISEKENIKLLLNMGADDYVVKPFSSEEFIARIQSHLRVKTLYEDLRAANEKLAQFNETLEQRVRERTLELRESNLDAIFSLAMAAEAKDENTGNHVMRIRGFSEALAIKMGLNQAQAEDIGYASIMHDVGKISIPDDILKKPGKLTDGEFTVMKLHTVHGERILPKKPFFIMARMIARGHHEKWNGAGYPDGISGEDVPLPARIVAVADVFDALTTARPYKEAWPVEKAMEEIARGSGAHFDPDVVDAWLKLFAEGTVAKVMKQWE